VVTAPDFLFSAADLVPGPAVAPPFYFQATRNLNFNSNNVLPRSGRARDHRGPYDDHSQQIRADLLQHGDKSCVFAG